MKTNKILFIFNLYILLGMQTVFAKGVFDDHKVKTAVSNTELELNSRIKAEILQSTGLKSFQVEAKYKVNYKGLEKSLGVVQQKNDNLDNYKLPGLFVENNSGYAGTFLRDVNSQDIIKNITSVDIKFFHNKGNFNKSVLTSVVKRAVKNNLTHLSVNRIGVEFEIEENPFGKDKDIVDVLSNPLQIDLGSKELKIDFQRSEFSQYLDENFKELGPMALVGLGLILIVGLGMFAWGASRVASSISNKDIKINMPSGGSAAPTASAVTNAPQVGSQSGPGQEEFKSYIEVLETLKGVMKIESDLLMEMILISSLTEDFVFLMIMFDILPKDQKNKLITNLDPSVQKKFKEYLVNGAMKSYENEKELKAKAIKLIKLVKVSSLDPGELYKIILSDYCGTVNTQNLCQFIQECNKSELSFLVDIVEPVVISFAINKEYIDASDVFVREVTNFEKQDIVELIVKMSMFIKKATVPSEENKLHQVFAYMNSKNDADVIEEMGIDPRFTMANLFYKHEAKASEYLNGLSFEQMTLVCALLPDEVVSTFTSSLPELLQERIGVVTFKMTPEGAQLKGDFYLFLKKEELSAEVDQNVEDNVVDLIENQVDEEDRDESDDDGMAA